MNPIIETFTTDKKLDNEPLVLAFARQGNANARDLVVSHYLKFALAEAMNKFGSRFRETNFNNGGQAMDDGEIHEIATGALLKAIDEFDPEKGIKFPRFLGQQVKYAGLLALRKKRTAYERIGRAIQNGAPCVVGDHNMEIPHEADARDCEEIRMRELRKALVATDDVTCRIVKLRLEAQSWEDIGSAVRLPPSTARLRWLEFIKEFQAKFSKEYPEYFGAQ